MASTAKIYPTEPCHLYWRGTTFTSDPRRTVSFAGVASYVYLWPLPFDVPAYFAGIGKNISGIVIKSAKLKCKVSSESNTFTAGEYLGVGVTTGAAYTNRAACLPISSGGQRVDLDNEHLPAGAGSSTSWDEWVVDDAIDQIRGGAMHLVMYGNEYGVLYTNYTTVPKEDRPYLEIEYEEGTLGYMHSDGLHRVQVYYMHSDGLHLCQPFYNHSDGLHEISV
jgi:hypothetical protein